MKPNTDSPSLFEHTRNIALTAKKNSVLLRTLSSECKNKVLMQVAERIRSGKQEIQETNQKDLNNARQHETSPALLDRLELNDKRIEEMAAGVEQIASLPDPVGEITRICRRPNGMQVGRMRVPLGVIAIIFESRPNVTIDAAALCFKSGNAAILRGGSEAYHSNELLARLFAESCRQQGLPKTVVSTLGTTDREAVSCLLKMDGLIDVVIPRGGKGLIKTVVENSTIPVIKHYEGICHIYVDQYADLDMAQRLVLNAKVQRPGTCNALETLLVHEKVADAFLPPMCDQLRRANVELRGCETTRQICGSVQQACEEDWKTEYLSLILSIRIVPGFDEAVQHIQDYGSHHTDSIVTRDWSTAQRFLQCVDSSSVMVNVSTRFSDGFQYGLGAEIGISTDKLHARGPMGLEELTTQKFVVLGDGQERK